MYEYFERILKEKHLKPSDVSKGTGISSSTLSEWKSGKHTPSVEKIKKIADFLGVSTDSLLTGSDIKPSSHMEEYTFKHHPDAFVADTLLEKEMWDLLKQMPELKELIIYYKNMSADNKLKIIDFALRIKSGEKPIVCTDKREREVITAFRNTNEHLQGAVCNILGVKGDTASEMENLSEGSSNIG